MGAPIKQCCIFTCNSPPPTFTHLKLLVGWGSSCSCVIKKTHTQMQLFPQFFFSWLQLNFLGSRWSLALLGYWRSKLKVLIFHLHIAPEMASSVSSLCSTLIASFNLEASEPSVITNLKKTQMAQNNQNKQLKWARLSFHLDRKPINSAGRRSSVGLLLHRFL